MLKTAGAIFVAAIRDGVIRPNTSPTSAPMGDPVQVCGLSQGNAWAIKRRAMKHYGVGIANPFSVIETKQ